MSCLNRILYVLQNDENEVLFASFNLEEVTNKIQEYNNKGIYWIYGEYERI